MIIIEIKDEQTATYETAPSSLANILNLDHLLIESKGLRIGVAFLKGLVASCGLLAVSGYEWCFQNQFVTGLIFFMSLAFLINEWVDQRLSGPRQANAASLLRHSIRRLNPAFLAVVPAVFLLFTMNFQCLMIAISNMMEVIGIAIGVPLLLFGLIKTVQKSNIGKTHLYVGSASAFGGVALSIAVNLVFSNVSDLSIFSATNYFSNAIAAIYAPNVVLPIDQ